MGGKLWDEGRTGWVAAQLELELGKSGREGIPSTGVKRFYTGEREGRRTTFTTCNLHLVMRVSCSLCFLTSTNRPRSQDPLQL